MSLSHEEVVKRTMCCLIDFYALFSEGKVNVNLGGDKRLIGEAAGWITGGDTCQYDL